jgi:RHS repeat-associated protein
VRATASYDPWGVPQGALVGPFGFTGELHHGDQVYLRARWYTPGWGTFPTRDPFAGFPEMPYSLHAYQYAYRNPVVFTDPTGSMGHCALSLTTGPAAPVTGGLCVVASYAVAAVAGVTLGAIITCTGGIVCEPHGGDPFPGPPVVPGPGPLPPDAQPRVLPDGPYLPQTFDPPALAPNPGPAPTPTPGAPPVVLPHAWDCPTPAPTMTPTATPMPVEYVADSNIFMDRPSGDPTMRSRIDTQYLNNPSVILYIPQSAADEVTQRRPTPSQLQRLQGYPGGARIHIVPDPDMSSIPIPALLGRNFDLVDMTVLELARQRQLAVLTANEAMRNQVGSHQERRNIWGGVPLVIP